MSDEELVAQARRYADKKDATRGGAAGIGTELLRLQSDAIERLTAQVAALRAALETIAEGYDSGRHDGTPEQYPKHDADTMFAVARSALEAKHD